MHRYEPLFDELHRIFHQSENKLRIRNIWIADVVTHGESGVLNESRLGYDCMSAARQLIRIENTLTRTDCWDDHARDLLSITSMFREQMPSPLVGLGHSMGAVNIIQASLIHPRLFSTIVCIEPPIFKEFDRFNYVEAYWIIKRNDVWASRQDAIRETLGGGLQRSWDPRVLECWANHAFRELPTLLYHEAPIDIAREAKRQGSKPVTFSTTKHHAMSTFCRGAYPSPGKPLNSFAPTRLKHPDISKSEHDMQSSPLYRPEVTSIFRQLPYLRPSCFSVYGAQSHFFSASEKSRADKLINTGIATGGSGGVQAGAVEDTVLEGVGHFAPFEKPKLVAEAASRWLINRLEIWRSERDLEEQAWAEVSTREKAMVKRDMIWWAEDQYSAKSKSRSTGKTARRKDQSVAKL